MDVQEKRIADFMQVEVLTLSRNIVKQIRIIYHPTQAEMLELQPIGWIARDAIERGNRQFVLCNVGGEPALCPYEHWKFAMDVSKQELPKLRQIFLK